MSLTHDIDPTTRAAVCGRFLYRGDQEADETNCPACLGYRVRAAIEDWRRLSYDHETVLRAGDMEAARLAGEEAGEALEAAGRAWAAYLDAVIGGKS